MRSLSPEERAVEEAISAAVSAEEPGAIVTGWTLIAETTVPDDDDASAYVYSCAEGQSVAKTLGLVAMGRHYFERQIGSADD